MVSVAWVVTWIDRERLRRRCFCSSAIFNMPKSYHHQEDNMDAVHLESSDSTGFGKRDLIPIYSQEEYKI